MFRSKRLVWKNPELSVGSKSETRIGGLNCYEAVGEVCEAFLEVAIAIKTLLDDSKEELERGEQKQCTVAFYIFMVGSDPKQSQPTIIFASRSKRQRKMAKALVKEQDLLSKYPAIRLETLPQLPAVPRAPSKPFVTRGRQSSSYQSMERDQECQVVGKPDNLCGALLKCGDSQATLGGIIRIGSRLYGTTAFHAGLNMPIELAEPARELAFDVDFDSDDDEDFDATSEGSKSSDPDLDANASDCEDVPNELSSSSSTTISAHGTAKRSSVGKDVTGKKPLPILHQDMPTQSRRLDYRLVPLDEPPRRGNEVHLSGRHAGQILRPESMVRTPCLGNTSVWVATAVSGPVMGSLLRCPRFIKMAGWPTFEEVWIVKLERPSLQGDSGAWVLDADTGDLYGHITAGDPETRDAYILPTYKMFDDIKTSHGRTPSLQLNLEEQRTLDIKPDSGSGILQSPTQSTPPNIRGVKPRENRGTQSWRDSWRGPPPPPPVGATSLPLTMTGPPPSLAPIRVYRPQVNMRGPPPPPPAPIGANRPNVNMRVPPPPPPAPIGANRPNVNMRVPPPPPPPPLGAPGSPQFPIRRFAPGGPPPPPHFGAPGTVRISDITPALALTEDYCRRQLTTYEVYTLRKAEPLPTIEKKDVNKTSRSSSSKSAPKPSWQRVVINQEAFDQKDIITQIKKLDQTTQSLTTKKAALFPNQNTQVTKLLDEKIATEFDPAFTWTVAQLSRKETTNRSTGNKETQTMTLYLKRAPVAGADTISIFRNIERNRMQNYGFHNPAPVGSGGGPGTFPGSQNLGANVVNGKVAPGIVIVGDERKDSKSTLGRGTGDAPQENGRPKKSPKVHKTDRGYFSDNSSTSTRESDASRSTDSETSTFETSISSSPSTRRSRHRTGSSRRERDPYRQHEKSHVIREMPRRRPSVAYVPEPPRVNDARQAAKAAEYQKAYVIETPRRRPPVAYVPEPPRVNDAAKTAKYERSSTKSTLTTGTNDSGYVSQSVSSLGADPVAAEAFAASVEAATRLAATQRSPPNLGPGVPRSTFYRDDGLPRPLDDAFGELRIRDDLSLNSNLRRREDRSLDFHGDYFRDEFRRDDLISEDIIRRDERQRDLLDLPRMESQLGGECGGRMFEDTRNPFAPRRRWRDDSRDWL